MQFMLRGREDCSGEALHASSIILNCGYYTEDAAFSFQRLFACSASFFKTIFSYVKGAGGLFWRSVTRFFHYFKLRILYCGHKRSPCADRSESLRTSANRIVAFRFFASFLQNKFLRSFKTGRSIFSTAIGRLTRPSRLLARRPVHLPPPFRLQKLWHSSSFLPV